MKTICTCDTKTKEHEPWCDSAEDFSRTAEMDAIEAQREAERASTSARFEEVKALLGSAPWGLWDKVTRNPAMSATQIAAAIRAGKL